MLDPGSDYEDGYNEGYRQGVKTWQDFLESILKDLSGAVTDLGLAHRAELVKDKIKQVLTGG